MESLSYELNVEAAKIAKSAICEFKSSAPKFVAGAVGPTNRTLSLSPDVNDPGFRAVTWDEVVDALR
jgi:5-methyltetrahydrofolate--homocysteine methyltransferase